ncbi:hypothetical protein ACUXJO_002579, partial [Staphylococcus cohnii]
TALGLLRSAESSANRGIGIKQLCYISKKGVIRMWITEN